MMLPHMVGEVAPAAAPAAWVLIAIEGVLAFVFLWTFDKAFRTLFAPLLNRVAGIELNAKFVHWAPFGFLHNIVVDVEEWTRSGMAASERAIVYGFGSLLWMMYDISFTIAKTAYDFNTAIDNLWARLTRDAVPVKASVSKAQISKLQAQEATLNARLGRLEHAKQAAVGAATPHDLKLLQRGIDRLNARVNTIDHELHGTAHADVHTGEVAHPATLGIPHWLSRRLSRVEKATVGLGAVGLVTAALVRMGFKWVKCDSAKRVGRRLNCGSFRFLESLLSLAVDALVITNLCTVTKLLTRLGVAAQPLIVKLTTGVADLMRCQGAGALPLLPLASFTLPDVEGDGLPL